MYGICAIVDKKKKGVLLIKLYSVLIGVPMKERVGEEVK